VGAYASRTQLRRIETTSGEERVLGAVRKCPVAVFYKSKHFVFSVSLIAFDEEG
jgi:hypothetical protein